MNIDLNSIISFLTSLEIQQKLFPVKIAFVAVGIIFLGVIIFVLLKTHYLQWLFAQDIWEFSTFRPFGARRIVRMWRKILKRLSTGLESEYKIAVIKADDMLNTSLKRMGYAGQTVEERLQKITSATLPNIEDVYEAHKVRNNIVQDPDFQLSLEEAQRILGIYEEAFNSLQILT